MTYLSNEDYYRIGGCDNVVDLHGMKHEEVESKLENWLILHYNIGNFPIKVITGNSERMKEIVKESAYRRGFKTTNPLDGNTGVLIVTS